MSNVLDLARPDELRPPRRLKPQKRCRRVLAAAGAVAVVLFAAVYLTFFTPESPPKLRLSEPAGSDEHSQLGAPAGRWSIGAGSVAGYRVREKLLRLPAPNDAVGRTDAVGGDFLLEVDDRGFVVQRGMHATVDLSALESDEPKRDDHMRTMAIETDRFPTATFVSTADVIVPNSVLAGEPATVTVQGDLTIHGVTRSVTLPLDVQRSGDRIEVVSSFSFDWALFDMEPPNLSYVTVDPRPTMELQLFFDHEA